MIRKDLFEKRKQDFVDTFVATHVSDIRLLGEKESFVEIKKMMARGRRLFAMMNHQERKDHGPWE